MLTEKQTTAIKCAYADLVGAYQARLGCDAHDWDAHLLTITEMEDAFPEIIEPADLGEDDAET